MSVDGFSVFASLHRKAREERLQRESREEPAVLAGRALGLAGPLTLESLICDADLGALAASAPQLALIRLADGKPANDVLPPARMLFHFGCERLEPANDPALPMQMWRPKIVYLRTGVRAGKTLIAVLALLFSVLTCKFRREPTEEELARGVKPSADGLVGVRPGELVRAVIVAPKKGLARSPLQHLIGTMQASAKLKTLFAKPPLTEQCTIRRPDGREVLIELVAADPGGANLRSTWLAAAMLDEADFHDAEDAAVNLSDELRACRPRMLSGAQILVPSSPWADDSPFDKLFSAAFKNQFVNGQLAFHSDSLSMNPTLDVAEIEEERRRDPDNAAREYDAIPFGAGAEAFYPEDAIRASFTRTEEHNRDASGNRVEVLAPEPRFAHTAGGDMGFRKNSSALAISRSENGRARLAFRLELRPQRGASLKPSEVVREFAFWCMRYGAPAIVGDLHSVDATIEELGKLQRALKDPSKADEEQREWVKRVLADPFAKSAKVPAYIEQSQDQATIAETHTEMRRRMQEGKVELPADDRMREQARETRKKAMPTGHIAIILPKKGMAHGDLWGSVVIACALPTLATVPAQKPLVFGRRSMASGGGL